MFIRNFVAFFTSLRLTVVLLAFAILLVFLGTLAQVDEGLYGAQAHYFKQWLVVGVNVFGKKAPLVLPGGYLLGTLLLVNLVAGHIYRFRFSRQKLGIHLAHAGIVLLLVGQLATDMLARETEMRFTEGEKRNYSESSRDYELVFASGGRVTAVAAKLLQAGQEFQINSLPFRFRVDRFYPNSSPTFRAPMMSHGPAFSTNGLANDFDFAEQPEVKSMDDKNIPTVFLTLSGPGGTLGSWVVSGWGADISSLQSIQGFYANQIGQMMARQIVDRLTTPQSFTCNGHAFSVVLRPARERHDFYLTLLKATHTVYPGTDIPKDFRSRVRIDNPATGEKREVEISMNHPLRYGGYTFYQYQMTAGQMAERAGVASSSVLSVVRNPSWLTPYFGCGLVAVGLVIQFLSHLGKFINRRKHA